ncbi:GIY-YIG nuclease family protein [Sansalvadorimonas sp. 2012CJ34-2]|uniref:GIY-YIG nuclease family protein n=1 Tax=Parendozoicomonas callyspongiae TaxID=2942213 RepID=A0ABT0PFC2_9GAMM|nr:GIY-YIG nuclease family protein [Sansalvadorimonas sp. 2012CJ34-2]MCL6269467.1 GIY-YIG nuclease family protein [Sansalvadorimonas sp. 2012CJ34-2]
MIIFTVTNTVTDQIYVGSTRNDLDVQWEKMVAAAEQNLDYPLYRDIRRHGVQAFQREIYDMAETREELAELENDALDMLGGISLRGHKTSTVVIKKKKPVRRKKSDAEKELLAFLDDYATDASDDEADETNKAENSKGLTPKQPSEDDTGKGRIIKAEPAPVQKPAPASKPTPPSAQKIDAVAAAKAILAAAAKEEDEKRAATTRSATPRRASRTSSNVKLELTIDDTINAQLAAITAAVDGVLAGDSAATESLQTLSASPKQEEPATLETQATAVTSTEDDNEAPAEADSKPTLNEVTRIISGKEKRIMEAIQHHRELRAKRTSDVLNAEKEQVQKLLSELNKRIASMDAPNIRMYH